MLKIDTPFLRYLDDVNGEVIGYTSNHDEMTEALHVIYSAAGVDPDEAVEDIMINIAKATFTKRGEYGIYIIGEKNTGKVQVVVDAKEIRGNKTITALLPSLVYRTKWFGLLGYRITRM